MRTTQEIIEEMERDCIKYREVMQEALRLLRCGMPCDAESLLESAAQEAPHGTDAE